MERIAYGGLERRTPHTISEPSALLSELAEIRRSGMATEREECAIDRTCIASPILGLGGAPIAAISVTGSVDAIMPDRIAPAVRAAAMTLSRRIGAGRIH